MVNEVFSMFKTYLESKLDEKTKQLGLKSNLDMEVTQMKFKGNQKQFELNAQIDSVLDRIWVYHSLSYLFKMLFQFVLSLSLATLALKSC